MRPSVPRTDERSTSTWHTYLSSSELNDDCKTAGNYVWWWEQRGWRQVANNLSPCCCAFTENIGGLQTYQCRLSLDLWGKKAVSCLTARAIAHQTWAMLLRGNTYARTSIVSHQSAHLPSSRVQKTPANSRHSKSARFETKKFNMLEDWKFMSCICNSFVHDFCNNPDSANCVREECE